MKQNQSKMVNFFISNINNAKGLEFPFVICFAMKPGEES
ncbi:DNA/RNA helicase [Salmonella sp. NCTC 11881]|nr:DNA/RNA helicase [Salmonella sp. NCTC 11881]